VDNHALFQCKLTCDSSKSSRLLGRVEQQVVLIGRAWPERSARPVNRNGAVTPHVTGRLTQSAGACSAGPVSHCWGGYVGQGQREGAASDGNIDALLTCQLSHNKVTTASHFLAASPPESKHIIYPVLLDVLPTCGDFYRSGLTPRLIPAMFLLSISAFYPRDAILARVLYLSPCVCL